MPFGPFLSFLESKEAKEAKQCPPAASPEKIPFLTGAKAFYPMPPKKPNTAVGLPNLTRRVDCDES